MTTAPKPWVTARFLSLCLKTCILLMSILHTGISSVKADVRCYCNLPVCVITSYMCKSSLGTCVSDHFGHSGDQWRSRHACLELVLNDHEGPSECPNESSTEESVRPVRTCCKEDMCNYFRSSVDSQNSIHTLNHSHMTGYLANDDYFHRHGNHNSRDVALQHHLWFKAAVIAVPIAGGFILILLIIMAARILKEDHKRQRQLTELRRRRLNTHIVYCGEKSRLPKSISNAILNSHLHRNYHSNLSLNSNSLYKNVSIAVSSDTAYTDTSRDKYFVFDL